ncbi:MAG TPA: lasso peptide biosynthesis B2 protein [Candidatus Sulfotelmatobacter sp.]|nr:lasso peptide biosynthesis B2 protein [Candidatus Sulfotelmatobacter sp.]
MAFLTLRAYLGLISLEPYLVRKDFAGLYAKVRNQRVGKSLDLPRVIETICMAVDEACIWYWKEVLCLQRSAATACLLKQCGVDAQMMIGAQQMPFRAHAWVEVDGRVVNDKPYMREMYAVLDRC